MIVAASFGAGPDSAPTEVACRFNKGERPAHRLAEPERGRHLAEISIGTQKAQ